MNPCQAASLRVLVIGSGGREHALALALRADPAVSWVVVAPGNPGTSALAPISADVAGIGLAARLAPGAPALLSDICDPEQVASLAADIGANLVVVGPEAPLVAGVADAVRARGIACFGPSKAAAQLEGSKAFAKEVMAAAGVPTAAARACTTVEQAGAALDEFGAPYVVKDDGLAAGKGVLVTNDREAALAHAAECSRVVIEDYLDGPEVSLFVITDGVTARPLLPAQDFKRVGDDDTGPNTGGMGAYTPLPWLPADVVPTVMQQVVYPTLAQMRYRGTPFTGLLYVGLAITSLGPRVVEFNARFGDPETEVVLPVLTSPLGQLLYAAATGNLAEQPDAQFADQACVGVVLAAEGYPGAPKHGGTITLPPDTDRAHVIHAGTALVDGHLVAVGGRVVVVVGRGADLAQARAAAYDHIARIDFPDGFCRSDIAQAARLERLSEHS